MHQRRMDALQHRDRELYLNIGRIEAMSMMPCCDTMYLYHMAALRSTTSLIVSGRDWPRAPRGSVETAPDEVEGKGAGADYFNH